jgi:hypothetical protein
MPAPTPFTFVLDELRESPLAPRVRTRPMFGAVAVYIDQRIVFILRRKQNNTRSDDGVWIAAAPEHMATLQRELPMLRPLSIFTTKGWMNLPEDSSGFEEAALLACRLVIRGDARIGRVPKARR